MDQHAHAGHEEQPDGGERIEQETGVGVERGGRAVVLDEVQMAVAAAEPGVNNFLEGLAGAVREVRVLDNGEAGEQKRNDDRADADRVDRRLLQAAAEEEHDRGAEGREERDQVDVVKKHSVLSSQFSVLSFSARSELTETDN